MCRDMGRLNRPGGWNAFCYIEQLVQERCFGLLWVFACTSMWLIKRCSPAIVPRRVYSPDVSPSFHRQPQVKVEARPRLGRPPGSGRRSVPGALSASAAISPAAGDAATPKKKVRSVYQRKDIKFPGVGRGNAPRAKRKAAEAAAAAAAATPAAAADGTADSAGPPLTLVKVREMEMFSARWRWFR